MALAALPAATILGGCVMRPGYQRHGAPAYHSGYDHGPPGPHDDRGGYDRDSPNGRHDDH